MLRPTTLAAAAGLFGILLALAPCAIAQPNSDRAAPASPARAPQARPQAARAPLAPARLGFRFTETRPRDLRLEGHTLQLTGLPGEAALALAYPEALRPGHLSTAITPLVVPDPRLDWLSRCINYPAAGFESALSISASRPVLLPDSPGLRPGPGFADAR